MKTNYLKIVLIAIFAIAFCVTNADTFHSISAGGEWTDPATWEENAVPSASDDVIITGPGEVYVIGYDASTHDECYNLTINPGALLRHKTNGTRGLDVFGTLLNNGTISDTTTSGYVYIHTYGDIENHGIWNNRCLLFEGTGTQNVTCGSNKYFGCYEVFDNDNTSDIEILSDIEFRNSIIDLNNSTLVLPVTKGGTLTLIDSRISEATIDGNSGNLEMDNPSYIYTNVTISDIALQGIINVFSITNVMEGEVIVEGILQNRINSSATLHVNGNLSNEGIIQNSNNNLTLYIEGNINNNGTWQNTTTWLSGTGEHSITQGSLGGFSGQFFYAETGTGLITANSDLDFNGTAIDLNSITLVLPVTKGGTLTLIDSRISEATIDGNSGNLEMDNPSYIYTNVTISDITLQGIINVFSITNVMEGEVIVEGILQNRINSSATLHVNGNLSNEGIIQNSNNNLTLYIEGNINNNGTWQNTTTWLSGTGEHSITQGTLGGFSGQYFYTETGTGLITAYSTLDFDGTTVDLNGDTLDCVPLKGDGLNFTDGILRDGTVYGNNNELTMDIDSYLMDIAIHDFVLKGTVPVQNNNVVFEGNTIVEGILKNYSLSSNLTVNGSLTNNGTMENLTNSLNLYLNDDFINNGICTNYRIVFNSSSDQNVACLNGNILVTRYIDNTDPLSKIIATDDLLFHTSLIDLDGGEIQMPFGKKFMLTGVSSAEGRLYSGTISGESFDYEGNDEAYIQNITFEPEVTLYGEIHITTQATFSESINLKGTLQNHTMGSTIHSAGRIVNNGVIQDGVGNHLTINCQDHIINNGIWTNYRTTLNGVDDQLIYLIAGKEMTGEFRFNVIIDDPPHQWKWNGTNLNSADFTGETTNLLVWEVPVSTDYLGDYKCYGASDSSRTILIRSGIIIDPVVQLQGPYNGTDMNTELAAQDLIPLTQPFNVAPWNYAGDETVTSIPSNIVDWVLVELRETAGGPEDATSDSIVMRRALMLRNDGRAVDPYHQSPELKYDIDLNENIYMVIWHRNHLGVMSAVPVSDGDSPAFYDFSESASQAYGSSDALIDLGNGVYGMMGGDADYSQTITVQDRLGFWEPHVGLPCGYEAFDFTLDGQIDNQDKNQTWAKTLGAEMQVPD